MKHTTANIFYVTTEGPKGTVAVVQFDRMVSSDKRGQWFVSRCWQNFIMNVFTVEKTNIKKKDADGFWVFSSELLFFTSLPP